MKNYYSKRKQLRATRRAALKPRAEKPVGDGYIAVPHPTAPRCIILKKKTDDKK